MKGSSVIYIKELELKDEMDYINKIWCAIMSMNKYSLLELLDDNINYQDIGKAKFIEKLNDKFQTHKSLGDSQFYLDLDECNSCNKNKPICKFIGNNSGKHFGLFFEIQKQEILDIYFCGWYGNQDFLDVF